MATLPPSTAENLAEFLEELGGIPPERIRMKPWPGTATEDDLLALLDGENKQLVELIDGVLVEKVVGADESRLAGILAQQLLNYLDEHDLGIILVADGPVRLMKRLVRLPDVC